MMNCLDCPHFTWWDGDYCCLKDWKILFPSENGEITEENKKLLKVCNEIS